MIKDSYFFFLQYLDVHPFIIPLGFIGLWRWGIWTFKEVVARFYNPVTSTFKERVSIVSPVYNEDPKVFEKALASWKKNNPLEIIAVIDYTDKACQEVFKNFAKKDKSAKLIVTKTPGKRAALVDGIKVAKGKIVALVDSDTLWDKDVITNGIPPFIDPKVAGVGTYQSVLNPKSLAQKIFDTQLDLRYCDEMPFLGAAGDALICLSGRTAFYRKSVITPMLPDLLNETFMGKPVISGDDKRLTYLVLAAGWKVKYQNNARVYTPGMEGMRAYMQQRLRWSRNSLRADLRALREGWPMRHPALLFFQIDKVLQALVVVLSPICFLIALLNGLWPLAGIIVVWWTISRTIRMYPHLRRKPQDIAILPAFIIYTFLTGIIKVYAFFTLNTQGWITRWDAKRLQQFKFIQLAPAYVATALVFLSLLVGLWVYKYNTYSLPKEQQEKLIASTLIAPSADALSLKETSATSSAVAKDLLVKKYVMQQGDALSSVAQKFGITTDTLLAANIARLTNWNNIEPGFSVNIPGKDTHFDSDFKFNYQRIYPDNRNITYDEKTNTITVTGRGTHVTLSDIRDSMGEAYIKEISPKVWFLTANLSIRSGVSLTLSKADATWIKLLSKKGKYVTIDGYNASILIDGVKITSWDDTKNTYDTDISDGRSFVLVKNGSRMDIYNSELAYLGFARALAPQTSPYGVSWRLPPANHNKTLLTGEVMNSKFHNNYFGVYTFGATGMTWNGNEFYSNIRYGFDPHDDSNGALIENNIAHDNGSHGFIISKRCEYNVFRNNISYNNKLHGIMLHEKSNHNTLENNKLYGNGADGIAIYHSSNNTIKNNTIYGNKSGVRANADSDNNVITSNTIYDTALYGIYLYTKSDNNSISKNEIRNVSTAIYVKTDNNFISNNTIHDNKIGVYFAGSASSNVAINNNIYYHRDRGIATKLSKNTQNYITNNTLLHNRRDIYANIQKDSLSLK